MSLDGHWQTLVAWNMAERRECFPDGVQCVFRHGELLSDFVHLLATPAIHYGDKDKPPEESSSECLQHVAS